MRTLPIFRLWNVILYLVSMLSKSIVKVLLRKLLSNIDPSKAHGPDNLLARFLKEVRCEIAPTLTLIFQASLDQGTLPEVWKQATVVPVFKKGSRTDPCNFRPISLTCICTKILEHIIYSNVSKHLQSYAVYAIHSMAFAQIEVVILS